MFIQSKYPCCARRMALIIVCLIILVACRQPSAATLSPSPTTPYNTHSSQLPPFIATVSPNPGAMVIQWSNPQNKVLANLYLDEILAPGEDLELSELQERVEWFLDGQVFDVEIARRGGQSREVLLISKKGLLFDVGTHEFTVRVHKTSGEVLAYSWSFTVVAEIPPIVGLPEEFEFVRPLPNTTITMQAYQEELLVPPYRSPRVPSLLGSVCVGVYPGDVVKPGEQVDGDEIALQYDFVTLDGVPPGADAEIRVGYGLVMFFDGRNEQRTSYPGPHNYKCWAIDLSPGKHEATVELQKPSGERLEYTWSFTITQQ